MTSAPAAATVAQVCFSFSLIKSYLVFVSVLVIMDHRAHALIRDLNLVKQQRHVDGPNQLSVSETEMQRKRRRPR